ncbi:hypothetical protein [Sphingobacterium sp. LRF_L2]|uniref:hypothetical protein n=1 Tax=Sphingobacterium sp. LRF_L2 TaxID=3369421 RepID=UPI003F644AB7
MGHLIKIICLLPIFVFFNCTEIDKHDKSRLYAKYEICSNLKVERYMVFGSGAFGGDLLSDYITDSTNFRKYVMTYDSSREKLNYKCEDKRIYIEAYNIEVTPRQLIKKDTFELNKLVKYRLFD